MKTMKFTKAIMAICILCFTLAGTTSCKKEAVTAVAPQKVIDQKLVGNWSHTITVLNGNGIQDFTEETFKADGTGSERHFTSNRGVVQNERIVSFEWFVKSEGVLHIIVSNGEEGDVPYQFLNAANTKMELHLPSGQVLSFGKLL